VFDELSAQKPGNNRESFHCAIYWGFATYFIIRLLLKWIALIILVRYNISHQAAPVNYISLPSILLTVPTTFIVITSMVLFFRKSMRAAIALLILGAIIELIVFHFMEAI